MYTRAYYESQVLKTLKNVPDDLLPEFIRIFESVKNIVFF